jgi:hypothetical protein
MAESSECVVLGKAKFGSAKPFERLNLVKNQFLGHETSIIGTKK